MTVEEIHDVVSTVAFNIGRIVAHIGSVDVELNCSAAELLAAYPHAGHRVHVYRDRPALECCDVHVVCARFYARAVTRDATPAELERLAAAPAADSFVTVRPVAP
jgi:hypothetical protein